MITSFRVFPAISELRQRFVSFVSRHIGGIIGCFVFCSMGTILLKLIRFGDKASLWVLMVLMIGWIALMIGRDQERNEKAEAYAKRVAGRRRITRVWQALSIAALPVIFVLLPPINNLSDPSSVWVRPDDGTTSLFDRTMFISPFKTVVYDVSVNQGISIETAVKSRDGIPLKCTLSVGGVYLDRRNPQDLEAFLVARSRVGNPHSYLQGELKRAALESLTATVAMRTSEEIASPVSQFVIPYRVGEPLYTTLTNLHLRFSGGYVQPKCRNTFES